MANKKRKSHSGGNTGYRSNIDYSNTTKQKSPFKRLIDHYAQRPWLFFAILFLAVIITYELVK